MSDPLPPHGSDAQYSARDAPTPAEERERALRLYRECGWLGDPVTEDDERDDPQPCTPAGRFWGAAWLWLLLALLWLAWPLASIWGRRKEPRRR